MERVDFLKLFYPVALEDYHLLEKLLKPKTFKKGEHLLVPGQTQKELFIIKTGVQMLYYQTDDKPHIITFTYPPNFCAIPGTFTFQKPSKYYLTTLTDSEIDCLFYPDLQELFDKSPAIERLFRRMMEAVFEGFLDRFIEMRSKTIEERFKAFCRRSPHLLQIVPHKHIASYLGIDPTNFSKLFNTVQF